MNHYLLQEIDKEIYVYKGKYGYYPKNLIDLQKVKDNFIIKDPIYTIVKNYKGDSMFYYAVTSDSFKLFSVEFDGRPFTKDDIYAQDKIKLKKWKQPPDKN